MQPTMHKNDSIVDMLSKPILVLVVVAIGLVLLANAIG